VLMTKYLVKYGVTVTFADGTAVGNFENAIEDNTKLIYLESPNSLTYELQDIEAIAKLAKRKNIVTIVDNSYNSPINQQPIGMGADMVVHSGTKYINGHSDVVAGVVCASKERIMRMMAEEYMALGGVVSPQDAAMMLRGVKTVYYPFATANPQIKLAKKQMKQGGGLLTIVLNTEDVNQVEKFCDGLKRFLMATSWGGYESLVFPLCALAASKSFENPLPFNMVRLYVGLEDADLLIEDLKQALERV
jgi:cystathionine beta-lyase/cystathionine gamma-synthase